MLVPCPCGHEPEFEVLGDVVEVKCPACGRFMRGDTHAHVEARCEKAVQRLDILQPCCKVATQRRVDPNNLVFVVCESPDHDELIHGRRHFPLEPDVSDTDVVNPAEP